MTEDEQFFLRLDVTRALRRPVGPAGMRRAARRRRDDGSPLPAAEAAAPRSGARRPEASTAPGVRPRRLRLVGAPLAAGTPSDDAPSAPRAPQRDMIVLRARAVARLMAWTPSGSVRSRGHTLVRAGPLRISVVAVAPDGELPIGSSRAALAVQVIAGDARIVEAGVEHPLGVGEMAVIPPGVPHAARSTAGAVLLLTSVRWPRRARRAAAMVVPLPLAIARWQDDGGR